MSVTVRYSHASPYILNKAAYACHKSKTAKTERDRRQARGEAYGLISALEYLRASASWTNEPPGIADADTLPHGAITLLIQFIGSDAEAMLGKELYLKHKKDT